MSNLKEEREDGNDDEGEGGEGVRERRRMGLFENEYFLFFIERYLLRYSLKVIEFSIKISRTSPKTVFAFNIVPEFVHDYKLSLAISSESHCATFLS